MSDSTTDSSLLSALLDSERVRDLIQKKPSAPITAPPQQTAVFTSKSVRAPSSVSLDASSSILFNGISLDTTNMRDTFGNGAAPLKPESLRVSSGSSEQQRVDLLGDVHAKIRSALPPPAPGFFMFGGAVTFLQTGNAQQLVVPEVRMEYSVDESIVLGKGATKTAHPIRGDDTKIALVMEVNDESFPSFLTEFAMQIVLHGVLSSALEKMIPQVYEIVRSDNKLVVTTQRVGKTLDVDMKSSPSDQTFCVCLYQVARTLQWLRRNCNFIHGDLKMNNVALDGVPSGCPSVQSYIFDFGFSSFDLEDPRVHVSPKPRYADITTTPLSGGPPGHNDLLFFLATSYIVWRKIIGAFNSPKVRSVLHGYVMYLMNTLYVRIRDVIKDDRFMKQRMYAMYNPNSAGVLDGTVGIELVKLILNEYKADACISGLLSEEFDDIELSRKEAEYRARAHECSEKLEHALRELKQFEGSPRKLLRRVTNALKMSELSVQDLERYISDLRSMTMVLVDRRKKLTTSAALPTKAPWRPT
jgi:hypothetical protein